MKRARVLLVVDATINLLLGLLLLAFPPHVVVLLGVPQVESSFYPNILGAVLFGIGIALVIECVRRPDGPAGLGLVGAIAINLCGGIVLVAWLIFGRLEIPARGRAFLWLLAVALIVISSAELVVHVRGRNVVRGA
jgi:hypothetical protein